LFFEGAAFGAQDNAGSDKRGPDTRIDRGLCGAFPRRDDIAQEPRATGVSFGEFRIATIAIEANRRAADKDRGRLFEPRDRFGDKRRTQGAAFGNLGLLLVGPLLLANSLTGEMNNTINADEGISIDRASVDIPRTVARASVATDDAHDLVTALLERADKRCSDKTR